MPTSLTKLECAPGCRTCSTGKPPVTDKDGRFTLPGVVPGLKFYLQIRKGDEYYGGMPRIGLLTVGPGEAKDVGERQLVRLR